MFTWEDKARAQSEKSQSLTLRPENTAGVVRAYIEHKLGDTGLLQKLYYIGPQFRRERPQKGRYRQFYQIGAEIIGPVSAGSESPARDAEVMELLVALLKRVGIQQWALQINSVGNAEDRARYNEALSTALKDVAAKMCADCQRRAVTNPLRVLDCKVPEDQPIIDTLPKISAYLSAESSAHFDEVKKILAATGVTFTVNERMVRGLDYYTRTTFEFTHGGLGAQSALLGGGRYDGLSEMLGGPKAPGIGFALGLDRFVLALQAENPTKTFDAKPSAYLAPLGAGMNAEAAKLAGELRGQGIAVEVGDEKLRLKKMFEIADRLRVKSFIVLGDEEVKSKAIDLKTYGKSERKTTTETPVSIRDLKTGQQVKLTKDLLVSYLMRGENEIIEKREIDRGKSTSNSRTTGDRGS
jgi:histidyl-tRNA synthetase